VECDFGDSWGFWTGRRRRNACDVAAFVATVTVTVAVTVTMIAVVVRRAESLALMLLLPHRLDHL
jgi:hypothetical protein